MTYYHKKPYGKRWTQDEEDKLLQEINSGIDFGVIARIHERSTQGIICRLRLIGNKMLNENHTIEEVKNVTRLTEEQLNEQQPNNNVDKQSEIILSQLKEVNENLTKIIEILISFKLT